MACCVAAAWLIGLLMRPVRALVGGPAPRGWAPPARWIPGVGAPLAPDPVVAHDMRDDRGGISARRAVLVLLGIGVEIVAALGLATWLRHSTTAAAVHHHTRAITEGMASMDPTAAMATMDQGSMADVTTTGRHEVFLLAGVAVLIVSLFAAAWRWRADRATAWSRIVVGVVAAAVAVSLAGASPTGSPHLMGMIQLELIAVIAPALIAQGLGPLLGTREAAKANTIAALILLVGLLGYPGVIVAMHLPAIHTAAMDSPRITVTFLIAAGVCGVALWTVTLSPVLPFSRGVRAATLLWTMEIACLVGLALAVAPWTLYPHVMAAGPLSALADQRLGGALMLTVDLIIALPALIRLRKLPDTPPTSGALALAVVNRSRKAPA
jgi:hypothetical protein